MRKVLLLLIFIACISIHLYSFSIFMGAPPPPKKRQVKIEIPLNCSHKQGFHDQITCPNNYPTTYEPEISTSSTCPDYFRWIHQDLKPWKEKGITRELLEKGRKLAHFKLTIINNNAYIERLGKSYQTRDNFTIWGILQLLRYYPGKVPDLELMFFTNDQTRLPKHIYHGGPNAPTPPPVFHYFGHDQCLDILFPDWTFWSWVEVNIKPWEGIMEDIKEANNRTMWVDRAPYAYWKGNAQIDPIRADLMKCNVSKHFDWNARLYHLNWRREVRNEYMDSAIPDQCTHRFKIYIEGQSLSVSEKYILACDSMALIIKPKYYDFYSRSLVPMEHYFPVRATRKCRDIKFAVHWGNNHPEEAEAIGKAGTKFLEENLKMEYIYDYMFHLLNGYAKLLKFKPQIPVGPNVESICPETEACNAGDAWKRFMEESMVKSPSNKLPCTLPPLYDTPTLQAFSDKKALIEKQVAMQADGYWENLLIQYLR